MAHCKGSKGLWVVDWAWPSSSAPAISLSPIIGYNSFHSLFPPKVNEIAPKMNKIWKCRRERERLRSHLERLRACLISEIWTIQFIWPIFLVWQQIYLGKSSCYYLKRFRGFRRDQSGNTSVAGSVPVREEPASAVALARPCTCRWRNAFSHRTFHTQPPNQSKRVAVTSLRCMI